jgi:hypothetical protein
VFVKASAVIAAPSNIPVIGLINIPDVPIAKPIFYKIFK